MDKPASDAAQREGDSNGHAGVIAPQSAQPLWKEHQPQHVCHEQQVEFYGADESMEAQPQPDKTIASDLHDNSATALGGSVQYQAGIEQYAILDSAFPHADHDVPASSAAPSELITDGDRLIPKDSHVEGQHLVTQPTAAADSASSHLASQPISQEPSQYSSSTSGEDYHLSNNRTSAEGDEPAPADASAGQMSAGCVAAVKMSESNLTEQPGAWDSTSVPNDQDRLQQDEGPAEQGRSDEQPTSDFADTSAALPEGTKPVQREYLFSQVYAGHAAPQELLLVYQAATI